MSLIHDALKKAQADAGKSVGPGLAAFAEPVEERKKNPKRVVVLIAVLVVAVGLFAYTKFVSKSQSTTALIAAPNLPPQKIGEEDIGRLKKRAMDSYHAGDYDAAWTSLTTASQINASDPEIWNNIGVMAKKRGDVVKAREAYEKALQLKPDYPECLNNIAVLEMQADNITKAREYLQKALILSPANAEANFHLAVIFEEEGDKKKAVEYYKRFVNSASGFPSSVVDSVRDHIMEIEP